MEAERILRKPEVLHLRGVSNSTLYADIASGLFPRGVRIGPNSTGWPEREVALLNRARIAGRTADEIRVLVKQLLAARTADDASPGDADSAGQAGMMPRPELHAGQ